MARRRVAELLTATTLYRSPLAFRWLRGNTRMPPHSWDNEAMTPWTPPEAEAPTPLPGLVTPTDPDWSAFQGDDPALFLAAAGRTIRKFLGWHLYPNITETADKIKIGSHGIIMLPSRYVTGVECVRIHTGHGWHHLDPHDYTWFKAGYIERKGSPSYNDGWWPYVYGNDQFSYLPVTQPGLASVTFTHGYAELPEDVKAVAYELAEAAMVVRSGSLKQLESPGGYKAAFSQNQGLNLTPELKNRLASYRVIGVA